MVEGPLMVRWVVGSTSYSGPIELFLVPTIYIYIFMCVCVCVCVRVCVLFVCFFVFNLLSLSLSHIFIKEEAIGSIYAGN